ncbi:MAG: hypothetical protein KGQ58_08130 [Proteobacteria bacterium]|nr:hypothetical protein [Pseudomonadota bacterium]MDE3207416.1 hypothetical protein [Pseudomonadota bacterium]
MKVKIGADEVVCLHCPKTFYSAGWFYRIFSSVSDKGVIQDLKNIAFFHQDGRSPHGLDVCEI